MDQQPLIYLVGSVLLCLAGTIATASVVLHARVRWWTSEMGRHLMAYMLVVALTLDLGVVRIFFGDSLAFAILRTIVFAGVPIVMGQRLWLQVKAQRVERTRVRDLPPGGGG